MIHREKESHVASPWSTSVSHVARSSASRVFSSVRWHPVRVPGQPATSAASEKATPSRCWGPRVRVM